MEKVNRIIFDDQYRLYLLKNKALEEDRSFCHHNFEHLLTVARLTYLLLLEKECRFISKEMAYSAGLLHDIGRWKEYQGEGDHAGHSAALAESILERAGFKPVSYTHLDVYKRQGLPFRDFIGKPRLFLLLPVDDLQAFKS